MFYANGGTIQVLGSSFETRPELVSAGWEATPVVLGIVRSGRLGRHKTAGSRVLGVPMRAKPITPRYKVFRAIAWARCRHQVLRQLPHRSTQPFRLQTEARVSWVSHA